MAEVKKVKSYIYYGCGFPVQLYNVELRKFRHDWIINCNHEFLEKGIILALCIQNRVRLTGAHIHFIRVFFGMTMEKFAKRFGKSQPAVTKWESYGDEPANIDQITEFYIKLFCLMFLFQDPSHEIIQYFISKNLNEDINKNHKQTDVIIDFDKNDEFLKFVA